METQTGPSGFKYIWLGDYFEPEESVKERFVLVEQVKELIFWKTVKEYREDGAYGFSPGYVPLRFPSVRTAVRYLREEYKKDRPKKRRVMKIVNL